MCSLTKFPELPPNGEVYVCEVEGKVQHLPFDNSSHCEMFTNAIAQHPRISIPQDMGTTSVAGTDKSKIFVSNGNSFVKQVVSTWYEEGLIAAISAVARDSSNDTPQQIRRLAQIVVNISSYILNLRNKFHPHLREKGNKLTSVVSQCREWNVSPVRCLDWHPHSTKLAVAVCNDSVRVYSADSQLVPVLKCQNQIAVSCLAWRPYSSAQLAVGCLNGVFLWTVDPSSVVARPSASCAIHLKRPNHEPVTAVAWSPEGDLLATASAADATMYIWDPAQERSAPLKRLGGGGVCLASWSPAGDKLFAATAGVIFRVWSTHKWMPERWSTPCGRVQTACWSPCGLILLFCTTNEPVVYALRFDTSISAFGSEDIIAATPVIDLSPIDISMDGERAGGLATALAWDCKGRHLAVVFKDTNVLAIFRTSLGMTFHIAPCCLVNGLPGEFPATVAFQNNFDEGSVLTIAWSTGRIQHFPIITSDLDGDNSALSAGKSRNLSLSRLNNTNASRLF